MTKWTAFYGVAKATPLQNHNKLSFSANCLAEEESAFSTFSAASLAGEGLLWSLSLFRAELLISSNCDQNTWCAPSR